MPDPRVPDGTPELGLDIIRVERIRDALARFGDRFVRRVLTPREAAYVRARPETFARLAGRETTLAMILERLRCSKCGKRGATTTVRRETKRDG